MRNIDVLPMHFFQEGVDDSKSPPRALALATNIDGEMYNNRIKKKISTQCLFTSRKGAAAARNSILSVGCMYALGLKHALLACNALPRRTL